MDYLRLIKDKEEEEASLYTRMQTDSDLLYLRKYVMLDTHKHRVPDLINVTLNKPAVFAANVLSSLGGTSQQTVVECAKESFDTHYIEEFQEAALNAANLRLQKRGDPLLNPFADTQLCIRGRTARRVLFRMEDDVLIPDIANWDGRYIRYEMGLGGPVWGANKTTRSKYKVMSDYDYEPKGKTAEVIDVWDDEHNEVWIDGKIRLEQGHDFGYCPIVIECVPLGYGDILLDTNRIEHVGESIFFLIRDIIPELNRLVTILQTLNMKAVKAPVKHKMKDGRTADPGEYEDIMASGSITAVDPEGDITPIDYGDAKQSAQMVYGMLDKAMQEGSVSSVELGNLQFPLSAVALVEIGEGQDRVFLPRLQTKALLNQATAEMFTQQVIEIGGTVELGTPGHKRKFNTSKLEGEYETTYKYFVKSPKIDIARMSVAQAAERYYDYETILTDILQVEDPKEIVQKRYAQLAEQVDVNTANPILIHRIILSLLDRAEDGDDNAAREAKMMTTAMMVRGAMPLGPASTTMTGGSTGPNNTQPIVPLLGAGGQVGGLPAPTTAPVGG